MKQFKLLAPLIILLVGFNLAAFSQETLPPVTVESVNYKYIRSVYDHDAAQPVKLLQHKAATYDVKESDYYEDEFEGYSISFHLPNGQVLATYDKDGKLLRTAERYKNIALPAVVRKSVAEKYPNWGFTKDTYVVNYYADDKPSKVYKMVLENGSKRIRIKTNEAGELIEK